MPNITIQLMEGRTQEQKRALVKKVTEAVCETTNAPPEAVSIHIVDLKKDSYAKAGKMVADQ